MARYFRDLPAAALILLGILVIGGWIFVQPELPALYTHFPTMKANTAGCFILAGIALLGLHHQAEKWLKIAAWIIILVSGATLLEWVLARNMGIDEWLVLDQFSPEHPGRMSRATALTMHLSGWLLVLSPHWPRTHPREFDLLFLTVLSIPLLALYVYLYSPEVLFHIELFSSMALHTVLAFMVLLTGIAINVKGTSAATLLLKDSRGGRLFRSMTLPVVLVPAGLGWLLVKLIETETIHTTFGIAVTFAVIGILALGATAWLLGKDDALQEKLHLERNTAENLRARLYLILDASSDALMLFDAEGNILAANSGAEHLFGYTSDQLQTMQLNDLIPDRYRQSHQAHVDDFVTSNEARLENNNPIRMVALTRSGEERSVIITLTKRGIAGKTYIAVIIKDANELRRRIQLLDQEAHFDTLTGIKNRRSFEEKIDGLRDSGQRRHETITIMILDIDHFKSVNDRWGHDVGDAVLRSYASCVNSCLREHDDFFRIGGEEFAVLASGLDASAAAQLGERIRHKVKEEDIPIAGHTLHISCSIGISKADINETNLDDCIKRADQALYQAKLGGRDKVMLG